jgi:arylsulfatase A-like enzyme
MKGMMKNGRKRGALLVGALAALAVLAVSVYALYDTSRPGGGEDRGEPPAEAAKIHEDWSEGESLLEIGPAVFEESILDRAEIGTTDGSRYVAFDRKTGLWALSGPGAINKAALAAAGHGVALGTERTKFVFHPSLVEGACLYAAVDADRQGKMTWRDSTSARGAEPISKGVTLVKTACPAGIKGKGRSAYNLSLALADPGKAGKDAGVKVRGMWIAPADSKRPDEVPVLEPCASGRGLRLEPGAALLFRTMGLPGREIHVTALGQGAGSVKVRVSVDGGKAQEPALACDGEAKKAVGLWAYPDGEPAHPIQVEASLPAGAGSGVCLSRLSLQFAKPGPVVTGKPPQVEGVVFILVDTLRADELGFINPDSRVETPVFNRLAAESVVFTRTTAHSHYTKPSMGTIFTGVYPHVHGALAPSARLKPSIPLITERMEEAGVDTEGIFSNTFFNNRKFGFQKGWDFLAQVNPFKSCVSGELVADEVDKWADEWEGDGPFFLYVHFLDPHAPYAPMAELELKYVGFQVAGQRFSPLHSAEFLRKLRRGEENPPGKEELRILRALYEADVEQADMMLGRVLDRLEDEGILDRALLIVTSDHGEEFMEHGMMGHGTNINVEQVHVPMLLRWPGGKVRGVVDTRVGHIDLPPTLMDVFGLPKPASMKQGRSLLGLLMGDQVDWEKRAYLSEHKNESERGVWVGDMELIVRHGGVELVRVDGVKEKRLDPGSYPITLRYMRGRMVELVSGSGADPESAPIDVELSEDEIEKLKAIGYIL